MGGVLKLSELRDRDVVNLADGRRVGVIGDLEIDPQSGQITAVVVPGAARFFGLLGTDGSCTIPWGDIVTIGEDVILVKQAGASPARRG